MQLEEAKGRFIEAWGTLGSSWGINRTMAQIHALLLVSPDPLTTEELMEQLQISRGNANMNVRALMDWGLVRKVLQPGERKDYYQAEKDIYKVARQVAKERRKRELEPMLEVLKELKEVKPQTGNDKEAQAFNDAVTDVHAVAKKADKVLRTFIKADENWFLGPLMKIMK